MRAPGVLTHVRCLAAPEVSPLKGLCSWPERRKQPQQRRRQPPEATSAGLRLQKPDPDPPGSPRRHRREPPAGPRCSSAFGAPAARSSPAEPRQSAPSCPRSPPRSPGHGQRAAAAPLRGRSSPASGGRREEQTRQTGDRERERQGLVPEPAGRRQPPPTLPAPRSARSPPPPSPTQAARPGRRSRRARSRGPGRVGGPRAPHAARALSDPRLCSGAPQNPGFQRPQRAPPPPPPRFQHCNCRGRYFLAYRARRCPTRRGGEQVGARGAGRGAEGEVRPGEHPRGHRGTPQSWGPPLPGAEAGGRGGEGRGGEAPRGPKEDRALGTGAAGRRLGPSPAPTQTPPRSPRSPSEIWGVSLLLKENFEPPPPPPVRHGSPGRDSSWECCRAPPLRWNIGGFFFLFCIIRSLPPTSPRFSFRSCPFLSSPFPFPLRGQNMTYPRVLSAGSQSRCNSCLQVPHLPPRESRKSLRPAPGPTAPLPGSRGTRDDGQAGL